VDDGRRRQLDAPMQPHNQGSNRSPRFPAQQIALAFQCAFAFPDFFAFSP
jgi:hypothetical protein